MLSIERARVIDILFQDERIQILNTITDIGEEKALNYIDLTGICKENDNLAINTIGNRLFLGSGGYNIVYYNLSSGIGDFMPLSRKDGHIIKMKYTPIQKRVKSIEEDEALKKLFNNIEKIDSKPVLFGTLHSMLAPAASVIKYKRPNFKITCLYTYGGAIDANNSFVLKKLKDKKIIDWVITIGECYGGDFEAINALTALIYAFKHLKSNIVIVCCGPGVAGTSTNLGFSTLDFLLPIIYSKKIGCIPIIIPRISFKDMRKRHYGISMQTVALLQNMDFPIYIPILKGEGFDILEEQIRKNKLYDKHYISIVNETYSKEAMEKFQLEYEFMGRNYKDDNYYFNNCGAAGNFAVQF